MCEDVYTEAVREELNAAEATIEAEQELALRPLNDKILVRVIKVEDNKVNGLYIPDEAKERPSEGVVIAVGKGRVLPTGERVPVDVTEGQLVIFGKYSGNEVTVLGEKLLLLQEDELMGEYYSRPKRKS